MSVVKAKHLVSSSISLIFSSTFVSKLGRPFREKYVHDGNE